MKIRNYITLVAMIPLGIGLIYIGRTAYQATVTIHQLLTENKQLKQAITNLTDEQQIGYAKVIQQETVPDGRLMTTLRFVETAANEPTRQILEKEFTVEGDMVHFDALIVRFGNQMVMDGKARAIYLWRRIYGEKTPPEQGAAIQQEGVEPARYKDLLRLLPAVHRSLFWKHIWELAVSPEKLKAYDIHAVYGNTIYTQLKPGLVYIFSITPTGQVSLEVVAEM